MRSTGSPGSSTPRCPCRSGWNRATVLDGSAPLVWLVRPTAALTALHGAVWAALDGADGQRPWPAPGRWVPHLSLALRFRDQDRRLARALTAGDRP